MTQMNILRIRIIQYARVKEIIAATPNSRKESCRITSSHKRHSRLTLMPFGFRQF